MLRRPKVTFIEGVVFAMMFAYLLPYLWLRQKIHPLIHDNLDSNYVWFKMLLDSGTLFASNATPIGQVLGIPRGSLPSEFDVFTWMYALLGPTLTYVANRIVMTVVAFVGVRQLLEKHIIPETDDQVVLGSSVCFAMLPFLPFGGLSVAGLPLVITVFLDLRKGDRLRAWHWVVLAVFPFYSSLVLTGGFLLAFFMGLYAFDRVRGNPRKYLGRGLLLTVALYLLSHYRLFAAFFLREGGVSHRVEFASSGVEFSEALSLAKGLFLHGQYHAHSVHNQVILPVVLIGGIFLAFGSDSRAKRGYLALLGWVFMTAVVYGAWKWQALSSARTALMAFFPINLTRVHFFNPLAWVLLFAISLRAMTRYKWGKIGVVPILLSAQAIVLFYHHENYVHRRGPTLRQFFAPAQFKQIAGFIGKPKSDYRVVSIGFHPSVAQFNGFRTLDGYFSSYPLEYKRTFRTVIAAELDRSGELRKVFDDWGSRIYVMSSELYPHSRNFLAFGRNRWNIDTLALDYDALRSLGVEYILSAVEIDEKQNPRLRLEKAWMRSRESVWDIRLYRVLEGHAKGSE